MKIRVDLWPGVGTTEATETRMDLAVEGMNRMLDIGIQHADIG
jgi:hypothetical protein